MSRSCKFVPNRKGGENLHVGGFEYHRNYQNKSDHHVYWNCRYYRKGGCLATLKTLDDEIMETSFWHTCNYDPDYPEICGAATTTTDAPKPARSGSPNNKISFELVPDKMGGWTLRAGAFEYYRGYQNESDGSVFWKCRCDGCPATLKTFDVKIVERSHWHTCNQDLTDPGISEAAKSNPDAPDPARSGSPNKTTQLGNQTDEGSSLLGLNQQVPSQQSAEHNYGRRSVQTMPVAAAVSGSTIGTDTETTQVANQWDEQSLEELDQQSAELSYRIRIAEAFGGPMVSANTEAAGPHVVSHTTYAQSPDETRANEEESLDPK